MILKMAMIIVRVRRIIIIVRVRRVIIIVWVRSAPLYFLYDFFYINPNLCTYSFDFICCIPVKWCGHSVFI